MVGISLALLVLGAGSDSHGGVWVNWTPNYTEALNQSQDTGKPLLLVLDDPSEPNLRTEHIGRPQDKMRADLLGRYERCHVDVTTNHGQQVAKAFAVQRFPFVAIIDKTATRVLYRKAGKMSMGEWVEKLAVYRDGDISSRHAATRKSPVSRPSTNGTPGGNFAQSLCYT